MTCRNCGSAEVEARGTISGFAWRHCTSCGHFWVIDQQLDVFSVLVGNPAVAARPLPNQCPPGSPARASRYAAQMPVRYRLAGQAAWQTGTVENISASGVLCRVEGDAEPRTPLELMFDVPNRRTDNRAGRVRCYGEVVRVVQPEDPHLPPAVGVAVARYEMVTTDPSSGSSSA